MRYALIVIVAALAAAFSTAAPANERGYSQAELDQMLAPVALYPDSVLSNILIAATYPVELVQAARWSRDNPGLEGEAALRAVADKDWDPSVKALVAFPELLARMDDDIAWTQRLGDAFMFQETMVMDTIQNLRDRAYAHGNLRTNEHVRVVREEKTIVIEPARREVVYVPYYDTRVVYGSWWWHSHPPVYWAHPVGYYPRSVFYWGRPVYVTPAFYYSSFYWPQRHVVVIHHVHRPPQRWHYTPRHRPPAHQHRPPPRRDAHRDWADQRRETYPRGFRGVPRPTQQGSGYAQRPHAGERQPRRMESAPLVESRGPRGMPTPPANHQRPQFEQRTRQSAPSMPASRQPVQQQVRPDSGPRGMPAPARTMPSAPAQTQRAAPAQTQRAAPAPRAPAAPQAAPQQRPTTGPRGMPRPQRPSNVDSDSGSAERVR